MKKLLFSLILAAYIINIHAQIVSSYSINVEFFPEDAKMWGHPVSPDAFMQGKSQVEFSELTSDKIIFYLHGELKIDSIMSGNKQIEYNSDKVLYDYSYNRLALKVTVISSDVEIDKTLNIYYSGFMNPSKGGSLSNYMHINKINGVFLRAYGYSLWFPVFLESNQDSYKANFKNITVKLPKNFKCIVTGELINENTENDIYTAIWRPGISDINDIL